MTLQEELTKLRQIVSEIKIEFIKAFPALRKLLARLRGLK